MIQIRQLLLEHPDEVIYNGKIFKWSSDSVLGVFSIFKDQKTGKMVSAVSRSKDGKTETSSPELNKILKDEDMDSHSDIYPIHPDLLSIFVDIDRIPTFTHTFEYRNDRKDIPVSGRAWDAKEKSGETQTIVSVWSRLNVYPQYKTQVDECVKLFQRNPKFCLYEFIDHPKKWMTYEQAIGQKTNDKAAEEDLVTRLLKIQHTSPIAKQVIMQLRGAGTDALQRFADQNKTTVAAIRSKLSVDENSVGNLSYSDHDDPNIPYEAGSRMSLPHANLSYENIYEMFVKHRTNSI